MPYFSSKQENVAIAFPASFQNPSVNKVLISRKVFVVFYFLSCDKTCGVNQVMVKVWIAAWNETAIRQLLAMQLASSRIQKLT